MLTNKIFKLKELDRRKDTSRKFVFFRFILNNDINYDTLTIKTKDNNYLVNLSNKGTYQILVNLEDEYEVTSNSFIYIDNLEIIDSKNDYLEVINYLKNKVNNEEIYLKTEFSNIEDAYQNINKNTFKTSNLTLFMRYLLKQYINETISENDLLSYLDRFTKNYYNNETKYEQNWWDYEIGVASSFSKLLILSYGKIPINKTFKYLNDIYRFTPDAKYLFYNWHLRERELSTGANYTDMLEITIFRNILLSYKEGIVNNYNDFKKLFNYAINFDGIYEDGSFIQHGSVAYTGAYGEVFIKGITKHLLLFNELNFDLTKQLEFTYNLVKETFFPLIFENQILDTVRGRAISRENITNEFSANIIIKNILMLSNLYSKNIKEELINMTYILKGEKPFNNKMFKSYNKMNQYVFKNNENMFAISLSSNDITTFEYMNLENSKAWYYNLGYMQLYIKGAKMYSKGYFPTIDQNYLPGVTNLNVDLKDVLEGKYHNNKLTYGYSDNNSLFIHFDLNMPYYDLKANKSYLMFDNGLLQVISNVSNKEAHTTIYNIDLDNTKISNEMFLVNNKNYYIKTNMNLINESYTNSNSYYDINKNESENKYTKTYEKSYFINNKNGYYIIHDNQKEIPEILLNENEKHLIKYNNVYYLNHFSNEETIINDIKIKGTGLFILNNNELSYKSDDLNITLLKQKNKKLRSVKL